MKKFIRFSLVFLIFVSLIFFFLIDKEEETFTPSVNSNVNNFQNFD